MKNMKVQEHANVKSRTFFENLLLGSFLFLSWKSTVVQQNAQFWKFCEKSYNSRLSKWKPKKIDCKYRLRWKTLHKKMKSPVNSQAPERKSKI